MQIEKQQEITDKLIQLSTDMITLFTPPVDSSASHEISTKKATAGEAMATRNPFASSADFGAQTSQKHEAPVEAVNRRSANWSFNPIVDMPPISTLKCSTSQPSQRIEIKLVSPSAAANNPEVSHETPYGIGHSASEQAETLPWPRQNLRLRPARRSF